MFLILKRHTEIVKHSVLVFINNLLIYCINKLTITFLEWFEYANNKN